MNSSVGRSTLDLHLEEVKFEEALRRQLQKYEFFQMSHAALKNLKNRVRLPEDLWLQQSVEKRKIRPIFQPNIVFMLTRSFHESKA